MDWELLTITKLKEFLVQNNLSSKGTKRDLIDRLNSIFGSKEDQQLVEKFKLLFNDGTIDINVECLDDVKHILNMYHDDCVIDIKEHIGQIYGIDLNMIPLYLNNNELDNNVTMIDLHANSDMIFTFKKIDK